jgi:hypothetical protein
MKERSVALVEASIYCEFCRKHHHVTFIHKTGEQLKVHFQCDNCDLGERLIKPLEVIGVWYFG